jgi:hypothetical protein
MYNGLDADDPRALIKFRGGASFWDFDAGFAENGSIMQILIVASRAATVVKHGIVLEGQAQYGLHNRLEQAGYGKKVEPHEQ